MLKIIDVVQKKPKLFRVNFKWIPVFQLQDSPP